MLLCRLRETRIKTVDHIVSGCGKLARTNNTIIILQDSELEVLGMFSPYRNDTSPAHDPGLFTGKQRNEAVVECRHTFESYHTR